MKKRNIKDYSKLHIGELIRDEVIKRDLSIKSIMIHFRCTQSKISRMYITPHLRTDVILQWNELLGVNLFEVILDKLTPSIKNKKLHRIEFDLYKTLGMIFLACFFGSDLFGQNALVLYPEDLNIDSLFYKNEIKQKGAIENSFSYYQYSNYSDIIVSFDSVHQVKNYSKKQNLFNTKKHNYFFKNKLKKDNTQKKKQFNTEIYRKEMIEDQDCKYFSDKKHISNLFGKNKKVNDSISIFNNEILKTCKLNNSFMKKSLDTESTPRLEDIYNHLDESITSFFQERRIVFKPPFVIVFYTLLLVIVLYLRKKIKI